MQYVGIDLGGTGIAAGVVNEAHEIIGRAALKTLPERPFEAIVRDMAEAVRTALARAGLAEGDVAAIGIGVPGAVDPAAGTVYLSSNLGWHDVDLRAEMGRYFSLPVRLDNDANCAALAESVLGASRGTSSSILITIGTGIGAGMVVNGRVWSGAFGMAGEIGHTTLVPDGVPCACGRSGCLECYCSATALVRMARQAWMTFRPGAGYVDRAGGPERLTAKDVIDAARAGDAQAERVFRAYARYVAIMCDNAFNFLDPEIVVLGGGVSKAGPFLLDTVRGYLTQSEMGEARPPYRLELARLDNDAGLIGAALVAREV